MEAEFCAENILRQDLIHSETNLREGERWDRGVTRGGRRRGVWVLTYLLSAAEEA